MTELDDPDSEHRMACLLISGQWASDEDDAITRAAKLLEWVENGCMGLCGGCQDKMGMR